MGLLATTMASPTLSEVRTHLAEVAANPTKTLDERLLETLKGQILGVELWWPPGASYKDTDASYSWGHQRR